MTKWRRFEVMLPLQFNNGEPVPRELLARAAREIATQFRAVSFETQVIEGQWQHEGVLYSDNLVRITVDVADKAKNRKWMREFKKRWMEELQQLELWMVSYRIDIE